MNAGCQTSRRLGLHLTFTFLWAWPSTMILDHYEMLPVLADVADVVAIAAALGIAWRIFCYVTPPNDLIANLKIRR